MPEAATSKPARALVGALLLVLMVPGVAAAGTGEPPSSDVLREQARALMQEGARQMDDRQYDKAVETFSEAYRLVPSPKVLFNLGIAYLSVARYADALRALEGFLAEDKDAPAASQATARRHVTDLRAKVVSLEIKSDRPGAELSLDGHSYGMVTFDHPLVIDPGPHELQARAGSETVDQAFTAPAGRTITVILTFGAMASHPPALAAPVLLPPATPAAPVPPPTLLTIEPAVSRSPPIYRRPWFWATVGGGAAVVVAIVLAVALSRTEYPNVDGKVPGP